MDGREKEPNPIQVWHLQGHFQKGCVEKRNGCGLFAYCMPRRNSYARRAMTGPETLILTAADTRDLLDPRELLPELREAFAKYSTQRTVPARVHQGGHGFGPCLLL